MTSNIMAVGHMNKTLDQWLSGTSCAKAKGYPSLRDAWCSETNPTAEEIPYLLFSQLHLSRVMLPTITRLYSDQPANKLRANDRKHR